MYLNHNTSLSSSIVNHCNSTLNHCRNIAEWIQFQTKICRVLEFQITPTNTFQSSPNPKRLLKKVMNLSTLIMVITAV